MTCKTPLLRATTSQTGPGEPGKTPSDKVAYLLYFYILNPTFRLSYPALNRGGQDHHKVDPSRLSLNSIPLIIITKKANRFFFFGYWCRGLRACQYF
jgi:hypothetical protein